MRTGTLVAACLVVALLSAAAGQVSADEARRVWVWVDGDGVLSFTDDERRIPSAYRADAYRRRLGDARVTVDRVPAEMRRELLRSRLEALRRAVPARCACGG